MIFGQGWDFLVKSMQGTKNESKEKNGKLNSKTTYSNCVQFVDHFWFNRPFLSGYWLITGNWHFGSRLISQLSSNQCKILTHEQKINLKKLSLWVPPYPFLIFCSVWVVFSFSVWIIGLDNTIMSILMISWCCLLIIPMSDPAKIKFIGRDLKCSFHFNELYFHRQECLFLHEGMMWTSIWIMFLIPK